MKLRKKIISVLTPLSILTLISSTASADVFLMKDGTTINGSIISETVDSYLLKAEVSNNVYAEKKILKNRVAEITKTDLSIAAYEKLTSILPTPDLMETEAYETLIKSKVEPFLKQYPSSKHSKDAEEILSTLKNEYHTIKSGGLKIDGKLLTPSQIEANKYDVQASVGLHNFMKFAHKKHYRAALSTLERMEEDYPETNQIRKAQKVALIILPRYEEQLQKLLADVDQLIEKRERALERMTPQDNTRTKKIFAHEDQQYQNLLEQANASRKRTKWLPINRYFKAPIESNLKMVQNEIKRITIASDKPTDDAGKLYHATYTALESGNYEVAKDSFDKFKRTRPPEEYIDELEPRLQDAKSVMERLAKQKKEDEALAKKKAEEERRKLAEDKKNGKSKPDKKGVKEKIRDKHNTLERLKQ